MQGPVEWINRIGWRNLQDFEVHAMFIYWREMSVMMGCKWVPHTLAELEDFRRVGFYPLHSFTDGLTNRVFSGFCFQETKTQPLERHIL